MRKVQLTLEAASPGGRVRKRAYDVATTPPEMQRTSLTWAVLQLKVRTGCKICTTDLHSCRPFRAVPGPPTRGPDTIEHSPMRVRPCGLWMKPLAKRLEIHGSCLPPYVHLTLPGSSRRVREL